MPPFSVKPVPLERNIPLGSGPSMDGGPAVLPFESAARVPEVGDNAAIAICRLGKGTVLERSEGAIILSHHILEGHRFAIKRIKPGQTVTSWGLPFGVALCEIKPGDYLCNEKILGALAGRTVGFELPKKPNFADFRQEFHLDEETFVPGGPPVRYTQERTFRGYARGGSRGVGTRNYILVIGTSSRTAPFVRRLAGRLKGFASGDNLDGIVPIDHTEGDEEGELHNLELTLRTLAGFMVHPNTAAVLAVDFGNEQVNNASLAQYVQEHKYPIDTVLHRYYSIGGDYAAALDACEQILRSWVPEVSKTKRSEQSLAELRLGLQCGGSDAFSGISANPILGILSREIIRYGGSANLAETSELIGAEPYVLAHVRDLETAKAFLGVRDRFVEWAGWHGHSAESNPSGGNMYRGLYNITIKSIGAARKKDPTTRLDAVIEYAERMSREGFYFMDSPGNDLESIAGQVASGCNLILFATGNGSITNFPFVPTIKVMTTTGRFELVRNEMDFNAGRYLEGENLEALGKEAFDYLVRVASGQRTAGEKAGHSQVQLWREWRQESKTSIERRSTLLSGEPMVPRFLPACKMPLLTKARREIELIVPTSLCSGQIAAGLARQMRKRHPAREFAALPHTEGCGNSIGDNEELFMRTMVGYVKHPAVHRVLLLEHGCEKTHNDAFRHVLEQRGVDRSRIGWASIQMDGGLEKVSRRVTDYFERDVEKGAVGADQVNIGVVGEIPQELYPTVINLSMELLAQGVGLVLADHHPSLIQLAGELINGKEIEPTLAYGQEICRSGLHMMEAATRNIIETITGVAATGVDLVIVFRGEAVVPGNPVVPVVQVALRGREMDPVDADLVLSPGENIERLWTKIQEALEGSPTRAQELENIAFQITRGYYGISL